MTLEYLEEHKRKYQNKSQYFRAISFDHLADTFQGVIDLISQMEDYIKENGQEQASEEESV